MPLRSDPVQSAADWERGVSQSTDKYVRGVQRVSQAPGARAAAKVDKYRQGVADNVAKWQANVSRVQLAEWQAATTNASARFSEGARLKQGKFQAAAERNFALMRGVLARVDSMPDSTVAQRIAKSTAFQQGMHDAARRGGAAAPAG